MHLQSLRTVQWRNLVDDEVELSPDVNVLVGGNGHGKTNLLEAVLYLAFGRSHRGARDEEIVRFGADHFYVTGESEGQAGEKSKIEAGFTPPRSKRLKVDGKPIGRLADYVGTLPCVSFAPEDVELARGAPRHRRRYLDFALAETSRSSLELLTAYKRSVEQRVSLLRNGRGATADLEVWDREQARLGAEVVAKRAGALAGLGPMAKTAFEKLAEGRPLEMRYAVQVLGRSFAVGPELDELLGMAETGVLETAFRERLVQLREAERARGQSLVGPHRDDLDLECGGRDLRRFGSHGQSRVAALALRLSQVEFIAERRGEAPVVVLDDVFAELDDARIEALWSALRGRHQTLLAVPGDAPLALETGDTVFRVATGRVHRET